jgi:hypothetical protein
MRSSILFRDGAWCAAVPLFLEILQMPNHHDENFCRSQPTWELICELIGERHNERNRAVLRERIEALGLLDLFELVTVEAMHSGTPEPLLVDWDPAM